MFEIKIDPAVMPPARSLRHDWLGIQDIQNFLFTKGMKLSAIEVWEHKQLYSMTVYDTASNGSLVFGTGESYSLQEAMTFACNKCQENLSRWEIQLRDRVSKNFAISTKKMSNITLDDL